MPCVFAFLCNVHRNTVIGNPTIGELLTKHFHLGELAKNATIYGIAFCHSEDGEPSSTNVSYTLCKDKYTEPAIPALQRLRKYLVSTGRFGSSPFLVGQYGGSSELLQGYCRCVQTVSVYKAVLTCNAAHVL